MVTVATAAEAPRNFAEVMLHGKNCMMAMNWKTFITDYACYDGDSEFGNEIGDPIKLFS